MSWWMNTFGAWLARNPAKSEKPSPMAIIPGAEYTMKVGNPFMPDPVVRVLAYRDGWVQYVFVGTSGLNHTQEKYFWHCYKPVSLHGDGDTHGT